MANDKLGEIDDVLVWLKGVAEWLHTDDEHTLQDFAEDIDDAVIIVRALITRAETAEARLTWALARVKELEAS